jgi:molybdate/tungstate transport system permease protein
MGSQSAGQLVSSTGEMADLAGSVGQRMGRVAQPPWAVRASTWVALGAAVAVWLALLGPFGELIGHLSPHELSQAFRQPGAFDPLVTSLAASSVALVAIVVFGTPLAWVMARRRLPLSGLWQAGLLVPLLMPPLVVGLLLVFLFGPRSAVGELLARLHVSATDTFVALVLAEIYEALPYFVLGAQSAFGEVDPRLEQAASLLGHKPSKVLRRVTIPLAAPGLASSLAFGWARAIGAFGAVVIVAYHPYGLPMQIWLSFQDQGLSQALAYAMVLVVVALPLPLAAWGWAARARRAS